MPDWLLIIVMIAASYRLTRLIVRDTFPPVLWLRDHLAGGWRPLTEPEQTRYAAYNQIDQRRARDRWNYDPGSDHPQRYVRREKWSPFWLAELITCPWCASAYVSLVVTAGVAIFVGIPAPVLVWPAVWAGASLIASKDWA